MNSDLEKKATEAGQKLNQLGHKIDDAVEQSAEKHNLPKWKVWLFWIMAAVCLGLAIRMVL